MAENNTARNRILVAEDDPVISHLLKNRLMRSNYEVLLAADGAEAVKRAVDDRPDVILMDVRMPIMDGWQATRELRSRGLDMPIIAMTAQAFPADHQASIDAGCDDHVSKPASFSLLLAKIEALVGRYNDSPLAAS